MNAISYLWLVICLLTLSACGLQGSSTSAPPVGLPTRSATSIPAVNPTPAERGFLGRGLNLRPMVDPAKQCTGAPMSRLIVHGRARVTDNDENLNLRSGPSITYQRLSALAPNTVVTILDGPVCNETYAWYQVQYQGQLGWVAEGDFTEYYIEPFLAG